MVVVLPAPLGPRNPKTIPAGTSRETPSTARSPPKARVRPSVRIACHSWRWQRGRRSHIGRAVVPVNDASAPLVTVVVGRG